MYTCANKTALLRVAGQHLDLEISRYRSIVDRPSIVDVDGPGARRIYIHVRTHVYTNSDCTYVLHMRKYIHVHARLHLEIDVWKIGWAPNPGHPRACTHASKSRPDSASGAVRAGARRRRRRPPLPPWPPWWASRWPPAAPRGKTPSQAGAGRRRRPPRATGSRWRARPPRAPRGPRDGPRAGRGRTAATRMGFGPGARSFIAHPRSQGRSRASWAAWLQWAHGLFRSGG